MVSWLRMAVNKFISPQKTNHCQADHRTADKNSSCPNFSFLCASSVFPASLWWIFVTRSNTSSAEKDLEASQPSLMSTLRAAYEGPLFAVESGG